MWTGQRIDKFYELLVKESLSSGDIDEMDTKKLDKDANKLCMILETRGFIARLMFVKLLSNCQLELLS